VTRILILGANGRIANLVRPRLLAETADQLTLYLRHAERLQPGDTQRETIIDGSVADGEKLRQALVGQDVVYANLNGDVASLARILVPAMLQAHVQRLIWVTGSGLYHETPEPFGSWVEETVGHAAKENTRQAAKLIESSELDYTLIRAAFMTDDTQVDYELTQKGEPFRGTMVSRASIADLIMKIVVNPTWAERASLGIAQPGTENGLAQIKRRLRGE